MGQRFLIGQLGRYGDCLYATTIAKQIKKDYPDSHLTWAIGDKFKSILDNNPDVDAIWEIPIINGDYYNKAWKRFEKEAHLRKKKGEFDTLIFSQIPPRNWKNYTGTIRGTILYSYRRPITVDVSPVLNLSPSEKKNVQQFAEKHCLSKFRNVVLFECAPNSDQSSVTLGFAIQTAEAAAKMNPDTCFVISSPHKLPTTTPQLIDASELTYRENAELTHYCTLLIGCCSGLTWLSTSNSAKKLPMIQIIKPHPSRKVFVCVAYDLQLWGIDNKHILEISDQTKNDLPKILEHLIKSNNFEKTKEQFHTQFYPKLRTIRKLDTLNNLRQSEFVLSSLFKNQPYPLLERLFFMLNLPVLAPVYLFWVIQWLKRLAAPAKLKQ